MPYLQLAPHVSFALLDDGEPVFLDLRRDRYFGLSGGVARAFQLARDFPHGEVDAAACADLLETGLFEAATGLNSIHEVATDPVDRELAPVAAVGSAPVDLPEIWLCLARARRALRSQPIARLIDRCRAPRGTLRGHDEILALARRFRRARAWVPIKPSCLQDSLALHHWLTSRGAPAALVLGVKLHPFAAHCWVQLGRSVLNDRVETVHAFTPILAAGCG